MIYIGRAPYRISLLGGGSDLDWFVDSENYGYSLGYTLDQFSYSILNILKNKNNYGVLNYSSRERYSQIESIVHPLIRKTLIHFNMRSPIELSTYGFASGGSGLGGSSSFLLSFLAAISKYKGLEKSCHDLASLSCDIEINNKVTNLGRQDQYTISKGGLSCFKFNRNKVVENVTLSESKLKTLSRIIDNLYLIPTKKTRSASTVLDKVQREASSKEKIINIRNLAENFIFLDEDRDFKIEEFFNKFMQDAWKIKKSIKSVLNDELKSQLNQINNELPNYWIRLIGAGSGGYFLVYPKEIFNDPEILNKKLNLECIKANMTNNGASSIQF